MKYTAIILSIVLISISYIIYESESTYAMRSQNINWHEHSHPFEVKETKKEATQILRDSKATSFVPSFKTDYDFSKIDEIPSRYQNNNRSTLNW